MQGREIDEGFGNDDELFKLWRFDSHAYFPRFEFQVEVLQSLAYQFQNFFAIEAFFFYNTPSLMTKRSFDQLEAPSKKLKAKTVRSEAPSHSIAATRLARRSMSYSLNKVLIGIKEIGLCMKSILVLYLGVLSAVLYGRRGQVWKKVRGLVAMIAALYFSSQGWAMATYSPFSSRENLDSDTQKESVLRMRDMEVPMLAGIFSAFKRVIAQCISFKNQLKNGFTPFPLLLLHASCFQLRCGIRYWEKLLVAVKNFRFSHGLTSTASYLELY